MPQCYTKPKGSKQMQPDPEKYLYNVDTLWLNVSAENYQQVMDDGFRDTLISGREFNMDTNEAKTISIKLGNYENEIDFDILAGQPPAYQYSIRNEDMAIYFSKNQKEDNSLPMKVQINQFKLWEKGVVNAYLEALQVLYALGFVYGKAKINRIDFSVHSDQWEWNLKDLIKLDYPQNFTKDNFPNFWRLNPSSGQFETVYYGNRKYLQLRIYDKSKEIIAKDKKHFIELYKKKGMNPDNVWNVEIEVHNDYLKELKEAFHENKIFDDFDQCLTTDGLSQLWSFLIAQYSHKSDHWKQISKGGQEFQKTDCYIKRVKDVDWTTEREVAQIRGRLQKLLITTNSNDIDKAISIFREKQKQYDEHKKRDFQREVKQKKKKYIDTTINSNVVDPDELKVQQQNKLPDWVKKIQDRQAIKKPLPAKAKGH